MRHAKGKHRVRWSKNHAKTKKLGDKVTAIEQDDAVTRAFRYFKRHDFDPADVVERLLRGDLSFNYQGDVLEITDEVRLAIITRFSSVVKPGEPGRYVPQQQSQVLIRPPKGQYIVAGGDPSNEEPNESPQ